jgi:hypothetical protein
MTPKEQEVRDKDPTHVSRDEVHRRIDRVDHSTREGENVSICVITLDTGFSVSAEVDMPPHDLSRTRAFYKAMDVLQTAMNFHRHEQLRWMKAQEQELDFLMATGKQDGE